MTIGQREGRIKVYCRTRKLDATAMSERGGCGVAFVSGGDGGEAIGIAAVGRTRGLGQPDVLAESELESEEPDGYLRVQSQATHAGYTSSQRRRMTTAVSS